jgi:hypothetical protein
MILQPHLSLPLIWCVLAPWWGSSREYENDFLLDAGHLQPGWPRHPVPMPIQLNHPSDHAKLLVNMDWSSI